MDINFYSKIMFPVLGFILFGILGVDYSGSI